MMARLYLLGAVVLGICLPASLQNSDGLSSSLPVYADNNSNNNTKLLWSQGSPKHLLGLQTKHNATQNIDKLDPASVATDGRMDQGGLSGRAELNDTDMAHFDDIVTLDVDPTSVAISNDHETMVHLHEPVGKSPYHVCAFHVLYLRRLAGSDNDTFEVVSDLNPFGDLYVSSVDLEPIVNCTNGLADQVIIFSRRNTTGDEPELYLKEVWLMDYDANYVSDLSLWLDTCPNRNPESRTSGGQGYRVVGNYGGTVAQGGYVRFRTPGPTQTYHVVRTRPGYPVSALKGQPVYRTAPAPISYRRGPASIPYWPPPGHHGQDGVAYAHGSSYSGGSAYGSPHPRTYTSQSSGSYGWPSLATAHGGYQPQKQHQHSVSYLSSGQGYGSSSSVSSVTSVGYGQPAPQGPYGHSSPQRSYSGSVNHGSYGGSSGQGSYAAGSINQGSYHGPASQGAYSGPSYPGTQGSYSGQTSQGSYGASAPQGSYAGGPALSASGATYGQGTYGNHGAGYGDRSSYSHQLSAAHSTSSYGVGASGQYVAGPAGSMQTQQGYGQAQGSSAYVTAHLAPSASPSYGLVPGGGHGSTGTSYTIRPSGSAYNAAASYNTGLYSPSQGAGSGYSVISGGYAGAVYGAPPQGAGQTYGSSAQGTGQSYGHSNQAMGQSYGPSNQGMGQSYGSSNQGMGQSYGTSNQGMGQSYGPSNQGMGQSYGPSNQGAGQSYGPSNQGAGQSYGPSNQGAGQSYGPSNQGMGQPYGNSNQGVGQSYGQQGQAGYENQSGGGYPQGTNSGSSGSYEGNGGGNGDQKPYGDDDSEEYTEHGGDSAGDGYGHRGGNRGHSGHPVRDPKAEPAGGREYPHGSEHGGASHHGHAATHGRYKAPHVRSNTGHGYSGHHGQHSSSHTHHASPHGFKAPDGHHAHHGHKQSSYPGGQGGAGYNNHGGGAGGQSYDANGSGGGGGGGQNYGPNNGGSQQGSSYGPHGGQQQQNNYGPQGGAGQQQGSYGPQPGLQPSNYGPPPPSNYGPPPGFQGPQPALVIKTEDYEEPEPDDHTKELVKLLAKLPPVTLAKLLPPLKAKLKAEKNVGLSSKIAKLIAKVALLIKKGKKASDDQMVKLADVTVEVNKLLDGKGNLDDLSGKLVELSDTVSDFAPTEEDPDCSGDGCLIIWKAKNSTDIGAPLAEFMKGAFLRLIETQDDAKTTLATLKEQLATMGGIGVIKVKPGDSGDDNSSPGDNPTIFPNENDPSFAFVPKNPADKENIKAGDKVTDITEADPAADTGPIVGQPEPDTSG